MKSAVDHWPLRKTEKLESNVMTVGQEQTFRVIKNVLKLPIAPTQPA
jgi:hypothetical protein